MKKETSICYEMAVATHQTVLKYNPKDDSLNTYYSSIKLFSHLPLKIKSLTNEKKLLKPALRRLLNLHLFHTVQDYLEYSYN